MRQMHEVTNIQGIEFAKKCVLYIPNGFTRWEAKLFSNLVFGQPIANEPEDFIFIFGQFRNSNMGEIFSP